MEGCGINLADTILYTYIYFQIKYLFHLNTDDTTSTEAQMHGYLRGFKFGVP